jgi:LysM repeat protein
VHIPVKNLLEYNDIEGPSEVQSNQNFFLEKKLKSNPLGIHEVKPGETMYDISQAYGIQLASLKKYNNIDGWEQPVIGEIINLNKQRSTPLKARSYDDVMYEKRELSQLMEQKRSDAETMNTIAYYLKTATATTKLPNSDKSLIFHTVKSQETIFKIAKMYDVKPNEILSWNDLTIEKGLFPGQTLKIISFKTAPVIMDNLMKPSTTNNIPSETSFNNSVKTKRTSKMFLRDSVPSVARKAPSNASINFQKKVLAESVISEKITTSSADATKPAAKTPVVKEKSKSTITIEDQETSPPKGVAVDVQKLIGEMPKSGKTYPKSKILETDDLKFTKKTKVEKIRNSKNNVDPETLNSLYKKAEERENKSNKSGRKLIIIE